MLKVIWISDNDIRGSAFRFLKIFSNLEYFNNISGKKTEELITNEAPGFVFINIKRTANIDFQASPGLHNIKCLQVSLFTLKPFKSRILNLIFPSEILQMLIGGFLKTRHALRR